MPPRDFIIDAIEQIAAYLAKIVFNRQSGQYDQAQLEIAKALQSVNGLGVETTLRLASLEYLLANFRDLIRPSSAMFRLLDEQARLDEARGDENSATKFYVLAFKVFVELLQGNRAAMPEDRERGAAILKHLQGQPSLNLIGRELVAYYTAVGAYDKAEDWLFRLMGDAGTDLRETGLAFYSALDAKTDEDLAAGNFSRAEIESGLADFLKALGA